MSVSRSHGGSNTAADVASSVRISEIYTALTGKEPRRTGPDKYRGAAVWRGGDNPQSVALDDSRNTWYDFPTGEGGGVLDLVVRIRGGSRQDALRWTADFAGIPMDDRKPAPADRAEWTKNQQALRRDLAQARNWKRAIVRLTDELLDRLKAALVDPALPRPRTGEIFNVERLLSRLRALDGIALVQEYQRWTAQAQTLTKCLARQGKALARADVAAVEEYLKRSVA